MRTGPLAASSVVSSGTDVRSELFCSSVWFVDWEGVGGEQRRE